MKKYFLFTYYKFPIFLQNIIFSFYGLYLKIIRYNYTFKNIYNFLLESQFFSEDEIEKYQRNKLNNLIKNVLPNVPFYREFVKDIDCESFNNTTELLALFPVISKNIVKNKPDNFLNNKITTINKSIHLTSGTTGIPLKVHLTRRAVAYQWAIWWRHRHRFGLSYRDKQLMIGARVPLPKITKKPPFWRFDYFLNRVYMSAYHINVDNISWIASYLKNNKFDYISGYPSAISELCRLLLNSNNKILWKPKAVVTGSDSLGIDEIKTIKSVFDTVVTDQYGMVEFCGNLSTCEHGNYHLDFECCILEEVPIDDGWVKLLFTGLQNDAMPFIRYDVGDTALPLGYKCKCGRSSRAYKKIGGRIGEYIYLPNGTKVIGLNQVFEYGVNIKDILLRQSVINLLDLYIVPDNDFVEDNLDELLIQLDHRTSSLLKVNLHIVDKIERDLNKKKVSVDCQLDLR